MKKLLIVLGIATVAGVASAQSNAPVRDFGGGFAKFYQLGLPEVAGGVYGKLDVTQWGDGGYDYSMYQGRRIDQIGLAGNAWKVKELGEGSNRFVLGSVRAIDVMDQKTYADWQERQQERFAKVMAENPEAQVQWEQPAMAAGQWKKCDMSKDVAKMLKFLEPGADEDDPRSSRWLQQDVQLGSELLLFAAQLYRLGMKDEANQVAAKLFAIHKNPRQLLQGAVGLIAQEQYGRSYASFRKTHDWAKWHEELGALLTRFTGSWQQIPAVKRLADMVKARIDQPEPPALVGEGLGADDQKLARRIAVEAPDVNAPYGAGNYCWIFPQPQYRARGAATNDPLAAVTGRGMASVPMLVAMLKDNTLTMRDRGYGSGFHMDPFGNMGEGGEQAADMMFNSIQRPMTRGEVARSLLQPLLIMDDRQRGEMHRMSGDDMAAECEAWYKEYTGKSVEQLARIYMEKGDHSQRQFAMNYLMRGKNADANRAEIEKMLIAIAKDSADTPYIVQEYVRQRRDKASNFVEQVAAAMSVTNAPAAPASGKGLHHVRRPRRGGVDERETFVKQLRGMLAVRPVRELLNEFVSGTQSVMAVQMKLHEQIALEPPEETLTAVLDAAAKVDDPIKVGMLLSTLNTLKYVRPGGWDEAEAGDAGMEAAAPKPNKFDPARHGAKWNKLLDDKRGEGRSVRESAAWAIEVLYSDDKAGQMMHRRPGFLGVAVLAKLGERGQEMLVERARARLAGKTLPELPSAENVDDARRVKMTGEITAAPDAAAVLAKLTPDEQLALLEIGRTNKAVNTKLRPLADRIIAVTVPPEFKAAAGLEGRLKGSKLDRDTVRLLLDTCLQLTREGCSFNAAVARKPGASGTTVTFSKPPPMDQNVEMAACYAMAGMAVSRTNRQVVAGVRGMLAGGREFAAAWWPAREPAAVKAPSSDAGGSIEVRLMDEAEADLLAIGARQRKSEQDAFWDELGSVMEKTGAFSSLGVTFSGEAENAPTGAAK